MDTLEHAAAAVRRMESENNYQRQQDIRANGQRDRKVGAYGILESKWAGLSESLGYTGANWRDRKAQDVIAKEKLRRDYEALGSWELAVVAFRYGRPVAQHFADQNIVSPREMQDAGFEGVGGYVRDIRRNVADPERKVEGTVNTATAATPLPPNRKKAENVVRRQLVGMRNAQRNMKEVTPDGSDTEVEQSGDTDVPAVAE